MRLITYIILLLIAPITNASELDKFKMQRASIFDIGLLSLEGYFSDPIDVGFNLYREGFISGQDTSSYRSSVTINYGPPSFEKDTIIIEISFPFNMSFINQTKGISRKGASRLATAYFNSVRERLGIQIKDNGEIDNQSWVYIGKWFSPRGSSVEARRKAAKTIWKNIILKTSIQNVSQIGFLSCEARGITGKTECKGFGE